MSIFALRKPALAVSCLALAAPGWAEPASPSDVMVVFDASGSMWGQVDGRAKIEIARDVFAELAAHWAEQGQSVGLIAYGHRRRGDCSDIEVLAPPSVDAARTMAQTVQTLVPQGKTPLSDAVRLAAQELKFTENKATVVLLSDGIETCDLDPCAVAQELETLGLDFTAHVIGLDIQSDADRAQLQCMADNTGGSYRDARDAASLGDALASVTTAASDVAPDPMAPVPVTVVLQLADGTVRPATVTITAQNLQSGDEVSFAPLVGAAQIVTGQAIDLPVGPWRISAEGDGGSGVVEIDLTAQTETIRVPFAATQGLFQIGEAGPFVISDSSFGVSVAAMAPLQTNATYLVLLLPKGGALADQLTYSYRFGSDGDVTEHWFYPPQLGLEPGIYDIAVVADGSDEVLGRGSVSLVADLPAVPTLDYVAEPLSPGMMGAIQISGAEAGSLVLLTGTQGQGDVALAIGAQGLVDLPADLAPGSYRLQLDGAAAPLAVIDILPGSAQELGEDLGEDPSTMMSAEELAAETGPQMPSFAVWSQCDGPDACRVLDPRVDLEWMLPAAWASSEPYYLTTAAGAAAAQPSVEMARLDRGTFGVVLNPRQWDAQLGPCEAIARGQLCHDNTDVGRDLADYAMIKASLEGDFPRAAGWLPLGRSWSIQDKVTGNLFGFVTITEPDDRAEVATATITFSDPGYFNLEQEVTAQLSLDLTWDRDAHVTELYGSFDVDGQIYDLSLSRPAQWDGRTNTWRGDLSQRGRFRLAPISIF